jgi:HSP20 family protein
MTPTFLGDERFMSHLWTAPFLDLRQRLDELFEERIYRRWAIPGPAGWRPPLDLHETRDAYLVAIDLPGVPPDRVEVRVTADGLVIAGERPETGPEEAALLSHRERRCGPFRRSLALACTIDPEGARAECRHGTYHIHLPKRRPDQRPAPESGPGQPGATRAVRIPIR